MKLLFTILLGLVHIAKAQNVYVTPSGAKYHKASCKTVKNTSTKLDLQEALKQGFSPCKICKPATTAILITNKTTSGQNKATQTCKGKTKAGSPCKRKTAIGNGYCFQHQPG